MSGDNFICIELQGSGWNGDEGKRRERNEAYLKLIDQLEEFLRAHGYIGVSKTAMMAVREKLDQSGLHSIVKKGILVTKKGILVII